MASNRRTYDESAITTLNFVQHLRLRPGMYIGRLGDGSNPMDGIYLLLKEIVDNAVDEFVLGHCRQIEICRDGATMTVRDYGRGMPLGKTIDCVSKINTSGKFNADVYQFSVGMNGVGIKAVNALSSRFEVVSFRDGRFKRGVFEKCVLVAEEGGMAQGQSDGVSIQFTPDDIVFKAYAWNDDFIAQRLRYYAYLNPGFHLIYNGRTYVSKDGIRDLLAAEMGNEPPLYEAVHLRQDRLEVIFTHLNGFGERLLSFANGQYTVDGGTHSAACREGVLKGINAFAGTNFTGEDIRDGFLGAISVRLQEPEFESQTKNKLTCEIRSWVVPVIKEAVERWLHTHPDPATQLVERIENNAKLRQDLIRLKKESRERTRSIALRIPKLTDCKVHFLEKGHRRHAESSVFIVEGDSAGGGLVQCRDVETQAIYRIRGKPLNTYKSGKEAVYQNQELFNIMAALGIENDHSGLRYNKVIIATDADVDGMHIRNLLLTFFVRYFIDLLTLGHVYILETPLFRVRNRRVTRYAYSDAERDQFMIELSSPEVTRFKGLGEISPGEFKQFIGPTMRLMRVDLGALNPNETNQLLHFLMADNKKVPGRWAYICDNIINHKP